MGACDRNCDCVGECKARREPKTFARTMTQLHREYPTDAKVIEARIAALESALEATQPQRQDWELLALANEIECIPAPVMISTLEKIEWVKRLRTLATERRGTDVDAVLAYLRQRGYECADKRTFRDDLIAALQPSGEKA